MMQKIRAHFDGHAIIPDEPVDFPVNQPLTVQVQDSLEPAQSITGEEIAASGLVGLWKDRQDAGDLAESRRRMKEPGGTSMAALRARLGL